MVQMGWQSDALQLRVSEVANHEFDVVLNLHVVSSIVHPEMLPLVQQMVSLVQQIANVGKHKLPMQLRQRFLWQQSRQCQ